MQTCIRPKIFGEVCEMFPKRLIMEHDFDISNVGKFLENNDISAGPVLKVILLVRQKTLGTKVLAYHRLSPQ